MMTTWLPYTETLNMLGGMYFQSALVLALITYTFAFHASSLNRLRSAHRALKPPLNTPSTVLAMSAADVDTTPEVRPFLSDPFSL
jgi:hypothetical protein